MNRKTIFSLLVLLLVLLAPATGEAGVSAEEVLGSMDLDHPDNVNGEDVRSWALSAGLGLALFNNDGFEGLVTDTRDVMNVIDGRTQDKATEQLLPTRIMKFRFVVCSWTLLSSMVEKAADREQGKRSVAWIRAYLENNISGFDARREELAKIATMSLMYAMEQFEKNMKR